MDKKCVRIAKCFAKYILAMARNHVPCMIIFERQGGSYNLKTNRELFFAVFFVFLRKVSYIKIYKHIPSHVRMLKYIVNSTPFFTNVLASAISSSYTGSLQTWKTWKCQGNRKIGKKSGILFFSVSLSKKTIY